MGFKYFKSWSINCRCVLLTYHGVTTDFTKSIGKAIFDGHHRAKQDKRESVNSLAGGSWKDSWFEALCYNDTLDIAWFTFSMQKQGTREHQFSRRSYLVCWKESIQLAGFAIPNKKTFWVSSTGHQTHLKITYFNGHIPSSSLFSALNPWKFLWQLHTIYLCESRLWPTWECQSWCTELTLQCSSKSRSTELSTIKLEGAGKNSPIKFIAINISTTFDLTAQYSYAINLISIHRRAAGPEGIKFSLITTLVSTSSSFFRGGCSGLTLAGCQAPNKATLSLPSTREQGRGL